MTDGIPMAVVETSDQPLLLADGLNKSYGRVQACRDISFALYPARCWRSWASPVRASRRCCRCCRGS